LVINISHFFRLAASSPFSFFCYYSFSTITYAKKRVVENDTTL
jgi:hypothetical protein